MPLTIRLTSDMSPEDMQPLWPDIIRCLEKYVRRFPDDESVANIIDQCANGRRQLWVVQDEDGRVVLAPVTEVQRVDATGKMMFVFAEVGGSRLREAMPLIEDMESWAETERGCARHRFIGRKGWGPLLAPYGYKPVAVIYEKDVGNEQ